MLKEVATWGFLLASFLCERTAAGTGWPRPPLVMMHGSPLRLGCYLAARTFVHLLDLNLRRLSLRPMEDIVPSRARGSILHFTLCRVVAAAVSSPLRCYLLSRPISDYGFMFDATCLMAILNERTRIRPGVKRWHRAMSLIAMAFVEAWFFMGDSSRRCLALCCVEQCAMELHDSLLRTATREQHRRTLANTGRI